MKKLFLLLVLMLSVASSVSAEEVQIEELWYSLSGATAKVIRYKNNVKYTGDIVIPSTVSYNNTDYTVKSIEIDAFYGCSGLTSITIPNSVTSIRECAFYGCSGLTSITIPNSVTSIESVAFCGCSGLAAIVVEEGNSKYDSRNGCNAIIETSYNKLIAGCQNTTIPNSVTTLGYRAFYGCSGLTSITIPNSVTTIGAGAFDGCSGLKSITIPNSVTSIRNDTFYGCSGLTSITIPNGVTSIENYTFYGCTGLTSITIPNSVTSIGSSAFGNCSGLTTIVVEEGNPKYDSRNGCNAIIETSYNKLIAGCQNTIIPNSVTSIGRDVFAGCSGLTSVTIPNSVTSIGIYAFYGCSGLKSITIPNSVTSIGSSAFQNCSGLTSITIPNSVTSIGNQAFRDCSGLTSVTIGNSVTTIGEYAFYYCIGLTNLYCYAENVPTTNSYAFFGTSKSNVTLHVPAASVNAYKAVAWEGFKKVVALTDQETGIDVVSGDSDTEVARYTMGGQRVYRYAKGLNIIRMSNGKTKKMVVK